MLLVYEVHPCSCQVWWGVPEIQTFGRLRHEDHQFQAVLATQRNNRTQYATAQGLQHTGPSSGTFSAPPPSPAQCLRMRETVPSGYPTLKPSLLLPAGDPMHPQPCTLSKEAPHTQLGAGKGPVAGMKLCL